MLGGGAGWWNSRGGITTTIVGVDGVASSLSLVYHVVVLVVVEQPWMDAAQDKNNYKNPQQQLFRTATATTS
jgi:hypothetical protein